MTEFKNVIGEVKPGEIATIKFFDRITEESTRQFNNEFDFLENVIRPSLIRVLINCEGGSVLHGMTTYSTIQNCKIPTECINEGMAASMGSVIWAAGDKSYMRDYSILMIHNPFLPGADDETTDLVNAFINQIKTIYRKRFGLAKDHIERIMDGDQGKDGTYFDARKAVKAGIIPKENIISTSKQLCDKVQSELTELTEIADIQALMTRISNEADSLLPEYKHFFQNPSIINCKANHNEMNEPTKNLSTEYTAVVASLGIKDQSNVESVIARISELLSFESKYAGKEKELTDIQTVLAGKEATIQNLQKDISDLTSSLHVYKQKETEEKNSRINTLVESAIQEGKIDKDSKEHWLKMCESNLELAESILSSIPAREQISKEIALDPENIQKAADATKTADEKMAEKVNAVVGKEFEFKKITG